MVASSISTFYLVWACLITEPGIIILMSELKTQVQPPAFFSFSNIDIPDNPQLS